MESRILQKGVKKITQEYHASKHRAVDVVGESTVEPVIAHSAGRVVFCQKGMGNRPGSRGNASYGNCVKLDHGDGWTTLYAHLASVTVAGVGSTVQQGEVIGTMGNSGNSHGMHLHFEVRQNNQHRDPTPYLNADLPFATDEAIPVLYKAYCRKWLPPVTDYQERDTNGYAGITGKPLTALSVVPSRGTVSYRVRLRDGGWLPWVANDSHYAGIRGKAIDSVQMRYSGEDGYDIRYRVSTVEFGRWHGWCIGLTDATGDGYAGIQGCTVDRIQISLIKN